ncbi:MAG: Rid family hydrolase [Planctomycetota bacterium]|jgi:enamine deaminase RidA (YjgF/YER057c/UK114 family)
MLRVVTNDVVKRQGRQVKALTQLHVTDVGASQCFLVARTLESCNESQSAYDAYSRIGQALYERGAQIVHERIFGSLSAESEVRAARSKALRENKVAGDNPVTYIEGNPVWGKGFAGVIIHAVSGENAKNVRTIYDGDIPCGRAWRHQGLTRLILQNIHGAAGGSARTYQAQDMIERAECLLRRQGLSYRNVVRTWFYLSDILGWYGEFNAVRNAMYSEYGLMPSPADNHLPLPASTGVSGENPLGAAGVMDLLAVAGDSNSVSPVRFLHNRSQIDAFRYGSAFSRGAVIENSEVSVIQVSGTAAIGETGKSLHVGDIRSQISCTFEKIESLIEPQGAALDDICAATAFVKHPEHAKIFWDIARARGLQEFPAVCIVGDVCREELLFEIDAEVVIR